MPTVPFNKPFVIDKEFEYIQDAINQGVLRGDGIYTKKCHKFLEEKLNCKKALLTHSCTAALEMAAILLDIKPGDEIIMPSYTFVSTANAFVLRGGVPPRIIKEGITWSRSTSNEIIKLDSTEVNDE